MVPGITTASGRGPEVDVPLRRAARTREGRLSAPVGRGRKPASWPSGRVSPSTSHCRLLRLRK